MSVQTGVGGAGGADGAGLAGAARGDGGGEPVAVATQRRQEALQNPAIHGWLHLQDCGSGGSGTARSKAAVSAV